MATWTCPYCRQKAEVGLGCERSTRALQFGRYEVVVEVTRCRNPDCNHLALDVKTYELREYTNPDSTVSITRGAIAKQWKLVPESRAIPWPDYVPDAVKQDYVEACKTESLSPKASAALSRRCLQAIIRIFYGISKARLVEEIDALESLVDGPVLEALHALRKIGNIGAHPERDPTVIVDIEEGEAGEMIDLIEILIRETYVARHEREATLNRVREIAERKESERSGR